MIEAIEAELGVSFEHTPAIMVGDSLRDLQAGHARGCAPVLVLTGKGRETQYKKIDFHFSVYTDLAAFTISLLQQYEG